MARISLADDLRCGSRIHVPRSLIPEAELGNVVVDDKRHITMMKTKPTLNTSFLHLEAQVAPHDHLHQHIRIMPPSRIGIGNRLKMARLQADHRHQPKVRRGPSRAAAPDSWARPIGPPRFFGDMRRSIMPCSTLTISARLSAFCLHAIRGTRPAATAGW